MAAEPQFQNGEVPRLEVYPAKSVLIDAAGRREEFKEGPTSIVTKARLEKIRLGLAGGFLSGVIDQCRKRESPVGELEEEDISLLNRLVDSVTSEYGRAIVGLTVLQLSIKTIEPMQSVRLHKGGGVGNAFSWADGIPMRVLDTEYNTPVLRQSDLLCLNADGCFMTRSLAENYPYTKLYKAAIRGAKPEWLELVDRVEAETLNPLSALQHLVGMLINRSDSFKKDAERALSHMNSVASSVRDIDAATTLLLGFIDASTHAARLFEIAMHALCQVIEDHHGYEGFLKPLSQMRSANKKHGNIGDIEVIKRAGGMEILLSWDAKYGKAYLRDELDELEEKLRDHPETKVAGFVTEVELRHREEVLTRAREIEEKHGVTVELCSFRSWAASQAGRVGVLPPQLATEWIVAFAESICQRRRSRAPIDEPAGAWVTALLQVT